MDYNIVPIADRDDGFIKDKLVEYNLSMVPATQSELFESVSKKIVDEEGNIIAGSFI